MENKRAILAVSFGTSVTAAAVALDAVETALAAEFPGYEVRRAYTSGMIIRKLRERDGIETDDVSAALSRLAADGYSEVTVQPTYIVNGYEYEMMVRAAEQHRGRFETLNIGAPLLTHDSDYERIVRIMTDETPELTEPNTAAVFVGHGTKHSANAAYAALAYRFAARGHKNCIVGTVEAFPDMDEVKRALSAIDVRRVVLKPFMMVAGDHALNDICGGSGSCREVLTECGYEVVCDTRGLGEYEGIRAIIADHAGMAQGRDG